MKKLVLCVILVLSSLWCKGQDTQFSQYFSASLYLNPGFAGVYNDPTLTFNQKRQLISSDEILELTQVSFIFPLKPEGKFEKALGGIGLMAFQETSGLYGVFQNTGAFLTYAHNLKFGILSSDAISIGVQAGFESRTANFSELSWGSQYNPYLGLDNTLLSPVTEFDSQTSNFLLNAGIMYYYNPERNYLLYSYSAFSGISVTNLNRPKNAFSREIQVPEPMLWKYNAGVELKFNKLFTTPSLLVQYANGNYQFNAGMFIAYAPLSDRYRATGPQLLLGSWYRFRDSFIFMGGVQLNGIAIRASYDLNTRFLVPEQKTNVSQNSFEISVQYTLGAKKNSIRKISNPLF